MLCLRTETYLPEPMQDAISDNALMERIAQADRGAFRLLVGRHLPKAHAIARRMLPSREDAEEAAQDAFGKVWVNAARFDPHKAAFGTWFYRILANTCLDMARRRPVAQTVLSEEWPDTGAAQDATMMEKQESTRIRAAVQALPVRQRMAVVLCYFEEMTNPEAAAAMDMHVKALEGLLVRARKTLRHTLE